MKKAEEIPTNIQAIFDIIKEVRKEERNKTLEDVEEMIEEIIPKITDKEYQGITDGFKHYGIDCKLGRETLLDKLKTLKL